MEPTVTSTILRLEANPLVSGTGRRDESEEFSDTIPIDEALEEEEYIFCMFDVWYLLASMPLQFKITTAFALLWRTRLQLRLLYGH